MQLANTLMYTALWTGLGGMLTYQWWGWLWWDYKTADGIGSYITGWPTYHQWGWLLRWRMVNVPPMGLVLTLAWGLQYPGRGWLLRHQMANVPPTELALMLWDGWCTFPFLGTFLMAKMSKHFLSRKKSTVKMLKYFPKRKYCDG